MKGRKKRVVLAAAVCLAALCVAGAAAADPGSQGDPLVTLSYLTDTLTPSLLKEVDTAVADREKALTDKLQTAIDAYSQEVSDAMAESGKGGNQDTYTPVTIPAGGTMSLTAGSEVILCSGSALCSAPAAPGLVDTTAGSALDSGSALALNHLYAVPGEGRSIQTSAGAEVLVRGGYALS